MKKNIKRFLSVILCLLILFSIFPSTAYGATTDITIQDEFFTMITYSDGTASMNSSCSVATYIGNSSKKCSQIQNFWVRSGFYPYIYVKEKSDLKVYLVLDNTALAGCLSPYMCYVDCNDTEYYVDNISYEIKSDGLDDYLYYYFEFNNIPASTNDDQNVNIYLYCECSCSSSSSAYFYLADFGVEVTPIDESFFSRVTSFLSDIISSLADWFTNLVDSIKNGFTDLTSNISSFFTNLTDSISSFFSGLTDNLKSWFDDVGDWFSDLWDSLKAWFEDVGEWFTDLGDNIKSFFDDLWTNLTDSITDIRTSIQDWWQSVVDFFKSLFVPEDGFFEQYREDWELWFQEHFGFLYDVFNLMDDIISFLSLLGDNIDECYITIPEITLPFLSNPTIVEETTLNMMALIEAHSYIYYIYELYQIIVSALGFFLIVKFGLSTFSTILTGDDDNL